MEDGGPMEDIATIEVRKFFYRAGMERGVWIGILLGVLISYLIFGL